MSSVLAINKIYDFDFQLRMPELEGRGVSADTFLGLDECNSDINDYIIEGYKDYLKVPSFKYYNRDNHKPPHLWIHEGHPTIKQHLSQACKLYDISDNTITEVNRLNDLFNLGLKYINKESDKDKFFAWYNENFGPVLSSNPVWAKIFDK